MCKTLYITKHPESELFNLVILHIKIQTTFCKNMIKTRSSGSQQIYTFRKKMNFIIMSFMRNLDVVLPPDVYFLSAFVQYLVFLSLRIYFQKVRSSERLTFKRHATFRKLRSLGISESSHEM